MTVGGDGGHAPPPPPAFAPAWWCRGRHLQTVWGPIARPSLDDLRRERVELPDGDFVDVDHLDGPSGSPILIVLHGLEGSSRSHYAAGLLREARPRGWRGAALCFRSCSGEPNRLPRFYHSGDTGDLDVVVRRLRASEPETPLVAAGVSLGGNVLLKWLGEQGADSQLSAAAAISVPFDLAACAAALDSGWHRRTYTWRFLRSMREKLRAKARTHGAFVDLDAALGARTFASYDRAVTAPLHGYRDERDYWARASSGPWLGRIRRPTLLLSARDDPFVPAASLPDPALLPPSVVAAFPERGGHAGFIEGCWPWGCASWAERSAVAFLAAALARV